MCIFVLRFSSVLDWILHIACSVSTLKEVWEGHNDTLLKISKALTESAFFLVRNERKGEKGTNLGKKTDQKKILKLPIASASMWAGAC